MSAPDWQTHGVHAVNGKLGEVRCCHPTLPVVLNRCTQCVSRRFALVPAIASSSRLLTSLSNIWVSICRP